MMHHQQHGPSQVSELLSQSHGHSTTGLVVSTPPFAA